MKSGPLVVTFLIMSGISLTFQLCADWNGYNTGIKNKIQTFRDKGYNHNNPSQTNINNILENLAHLYSKYYDLIYSHEASSEIRKA